MDVQVYSSNQDFQHHFVKAQGHPRGKDEHRPVLYTVEPRYLRAKERSLFYCAIHGSGKGLAGWEDLGDERRTVG